MKLTLFLLSVATSHARLFGPGNLLRSLSSSSASNNDINHHHQSSRKVQQAPPQHYIFIDAGSNEEDTSLITGDVWVTQNFKPISNVPPSYSEQVFQSHRSGTAPFTYTIGSDSFVPSTTIADITLGFAENYVDNCSKGNRVFTILVNDVPFATDLDVYDVAGCQTALVITKPFTANSNGQFVITFLQVKHHPMVSMIAIDIVADTTLSDYPSTAPSDIPSMVPSDVPSDAPSDVPSDMPSDAPSDAPSDVPSSIPSSVPISVLSETTTKTVLIDCGAEDEDVSMVSGKIWVTQNSLPITNVPSKYNATTFQSHRSGTAPFSYTVQGYQAGEVADVTLGFAENFVDNCSKNNRVFSVTVNGEDFVIDLDVYAVAGCLKALVITKSCTADHNGYFVITFLQVIHHPMVSLIEIDSQQNAYMTSSPVAAPVERVIPDVVVTRAPVAPTTPQPVVPVAPSTPQPVVPTTRSPTVSPSSSPSATPSTSPSATPSVTPTSTPSVTPTSMPSTSPSAIPTSSPSTSPSSTPSVTPSSSPSTWPSAQPSPTPTAGPSATPSYSPSSAPTISSIPTAAPSSSPSATPSTTPSYPPVPTITITYIVPLQPPTGSPVAIASSAPSSSPSDKPSVNPTALPSAWPSPSPSTVPSATPIITTVTGEGVEAPSDFPSMSPTTTIAVPVAAPVAVPVVAPVAAPVAVPVVAASKPIQSLTLVKAEDSGDIVALQTGDIVSLTTVGTSSLSIRADTDETVVAKVRFTCDGIVHTEDTPPFVMAGKTGYNSYTAVASLAQPGLKTVKVEAFDVDDYLLDILTVKFTINA